MAAANKIGLKKVQALFMETFGLGPWVALSASFLIILVTIFTVYWFFHSAPPDTITVTSGPKGSIFEMTAEKYRKILAGNGVKLKILPSEGSLENLQRLANASFHVDIGFVQGGLTDDIDIHKLVSLGSIFNAPILVFSRSAESLELLSQLSGKQIAIGAVGSGTRSVALALLASNGIEPGGPTALLDMEADNATDALINGKVDAIFLMGDSASVQNIRKLLLMPGIRVFSFRQADGYIRRISYLNKIELPEGSIDFGKNIPAHDVNLIGPTIELVARSDLHPALSDLLIEAAQEVHGSPGLFRRRGEFPALLEHEFRISADASRYYKSGKSFLYRSLPFWLASLMDRIIIVIIPAIVVLIPGLQVIPAIYRWRMMLRIYRWYNALLLLEQDIFTEWTPDKREEFLRRLDDIEESVNKMRVPPFFANQFYGLRGHISFVRDRLVGSTQP
jgi:TRAP-type uncharacterized transport system substrate-binding protein